MAKPITIKITGDTKGLERAAQRSQGIMGRMGVSGKTAALGIAGGAAIAGAALFQIGQQAETMRANIVKGTGASGDALDDLFESAKDVLSAVPDSGEVVSNALADVNTFFAQTGDELEDTTELFLDFARLTDVAVGDAIKNLDGALTQFGSNDSIDEALGDLARIAQATGIPMDKLLDQVKTFGPIFANANFSLEETEAIIGQLTMAGVDLTRVGPALNKFFRDTAAAGEDPQEALAGIVDEIANATSTTEALNLATGAFGAEGAQRMTTAIRTGNFDLEDFNGLLGEGAGLVAEQTAATETFSQKWSEIKNKVFVQLMPVAEKLFEVIIDGMEAMGPIIEDVVAWYQEVLQPGIEDAMADIEEIISGVVEVITAIWDEWGAEITAVVAIAFDTIKTKIESVLRIIKGIVDVFAGVFTGDWDRVWDGVKGIFGGVWDAMVAQVTEVPKILIALGPKFLNAGWTLIKKMLSGMTNALSSARGFVADLVSGLWRAFKDLFNTQVVDKINNAIPNRIPIRFAPDIDLPDNPIPRLAFGGDLSRGGQVLVGERGPELLSVPAGSRVEPNHGVGMSGQGGNITINAQTNANPADIAGELAWILQVRGGV